MTVAFPPKATAIQFVGPFMKEDSGTWPARLTVGSGLNLAQPIPAESNQPNELLEIRLKPTLQLGSKAQTTQKLILAPTPPRVPRPRDPFVLRHVDRPGIDPRPLFGDEGIELRLFSA